MRERHDNIGEVNSLVLTHDGRVKQVVLGVGGFLGIGEKSVAIDWSDLRLIRDSNGKMSAIVMRTKDQL
ncbi:PRC-barrel domain-containing protein, partial [Acinetobacter baumannii]